MYFIINPNSGSGKGIKIWGKVKKELDKRNVKYKALFSKYHLHATELVKEIENDDRVKKVIILGGDGTLNEVLNGIRDLSKLIIGYIPAGSGNDFARSLNMSKDPIRTLSYILESKTYISLDYGEIQLIDSENEGKRFACSSGIGFDANVTKEVANSPIKDALNRIKFGKVIYLLIALKQIFNSEFFDVITIVDGLKIEYKNVFLISNMIHKYEGGGLEMAPKASPRDGLLDIVIAHGLSRIKLLFLVPSLLRGKHIYDKGVEYFKCKEIQITANKRLVFHTDGETSKMKNKFVIKCKKQCINFIGIRCPYNE